MQTKREWLVTQGLAKPGRGKFSNAAKAALAKAEEEGMTFSDGAAPAPKATGEVKEAPKPAASETPFLTSDEYRYPENVYRASVYRNGKKVALSLRECCSTCKVSLVNHFCDSPVYLGDQFVKIERR